MAKSLNNNLHQARAGKNDEFYTQLADIEREVGHYKAHFRDKTVFCNCDDPVESNFWRYFELNFEHLGLRKLVTTHYVQEGASYKIEAIKVGNTHRTQQSPLVGNGDFRSDECIAILEEADLVVTNPPFSLFREYIDQLVKHERKFLVVGNQNAITYKDIFTLIAADKIWLGCKNGDMAFKVPIDSEPRETRFWVDSDGQKWRSMGNACWFTNLEHSKRNEEIILYRQYNAADYPTYDGQIIINVDKVADIPGDYAGVMGVPITFLDKYAPSQFRILGIANSARWIGYRCCTLIDGRKIYNRVLIERVTP